MFQESVQEQELLELQETVEKPDSIYKTSAIHNLYIKKFWKTTKSQLDIEIRTANYLVVLVDLSMAQIISWWRQKDKPMILEPMIYGTLEDDSNV